MIKFEKDNYIMLFEDADKAAEWLVKEFDEGGQFEEVLPEVAQTFASYVNDNYTAYDILCEPHYYKYDEMYNEWLSELAYDIHHNYIEYFTNDEVDND